MIANRRRFRKYSEIDSMNWRYLKDVKVISNFHVRIEWLRAWAEMATWDLQSEIWYIIIVFNKYIYIYSRISLKGHVETCSFYWNRSNIFKPPPQTSHIDMSALSWIAEEPNLSWENCRNCHWLRNLQGTMMQVLQKSFKPSTPKVIQDKEDFSAWELAQSLFLPQCRQKASVNKWGADLSLLPVLRLKQYTNAV